MITTTQAYKDKILSDHREMKMKVILNGHQEIDGHYLKNVTIHEVSNGLDTLTIGGICSNSIKIDMFDPGNIPFENGLIEAFIGVQLSTDIEWIPMGSFFISEITRQNEYEVSLEGYDGISLLSEEYKPHIEYPATLQDVVLDVINQCGLTLKQQELEDIIIEVPMEVTCKEMLGYMASLMGKNARMNRFGELEFYWYESGQYTIPLELQYQLGFKKTNSVLTISSLTSGDEEHVLTVGSGYGITFANPYMTQERLESLFKKINGFTYTPATLKWRGDPCLEVCDIVHVQESTKDMSQILIMDHTISFDGGMSSVIESHGQNEKEVVMSKSPTEIKLNKFYNTLIESYKQTTEKILGQKGGYYVIDVDENGYPNGWTIMNTPTLRDDTHLWRMSMGGFGYSQDGGKTFENIAFDLDGNFSANALTSGQLSGDMFELDLENGTVQFGMRDQEGHIIDPFLILDQNGLEIKHITEIEDNVSQIMRNFNIYLETNILASQVFDSNANTYIPDFMTDHLTITAHAYDLEGKEISDMTYTWKRKSENGVEALTVGEHADGNVLTISHNLDHSITYVCTATADLISKKEEFTVISTKTGLNGNDGQTGPQGPQGLQGPQGPQGVQGPKGNDGKQYYTWLKYADTPTSGMSDTPEGKAYIGLAYNKSSSSESNNYSDYTWSLIKGEKGDQGVAGGKGADGKTFYTWVKYATSSSGANMSDDPAGKTYIGLAYNKTTQTESTNAADYTWSLIKGEKGDTGPAGKGIKSTTITYQAGTSGTAAPTGSWATSIPSVTQGQYLWSRTVITYTDSTTSTTYSVAYIPKNGTTGATGTGVGSIAQQYYLSTSKTSQTGGNWVSVMPTWSTGKYLWTRYAITYTNPASTSYTSPICDSSWEAVNEITIGGRNLLLDSDVEVTNTSYPIQTYKMSEKMIANETYTCRLWGTLGTGKSYFGLWLDGGSISLGNLVNKGDGTFELTFKGKTGTLDTSVLHVYPVASSVSATSTITKIKLEKGNKATDWSPAPEDVDNRFDESAKDFADQINNAKTEFTSQIDTRANSIIETISKTYLSKETGETLAERTAELEKSAEGWAFNFKTLTKQYDELSSEQKENYARILKYIRFIDGNIILGEENNALTLTIQNDKIVFKQSNKELAYFTNGKLYVTDGEFTQSLRIGKFAFVPRSNGSLDFKKVGN
ncbi:hypothetical protein [Candidatus Stoquefichus sp. SB1]|uniref:hypothetical protein n=1 Tax=Candidatus Stoquefichus sp. SB1 TaxID=1658109 RepID=UPI000B149FA0|nr:hypothetical protein [Candidatus Stoquefichus sp. SB1]